MDGIGNGVSRKDLGDSLVIRKPCSVGPGREICGRQRVSRRSTHGIVVDKAPLTTANLVANYVRHDGDQILLRTAIAARGYCDGERDHLFW